MSLCRKTQSIHICARLLMRWEMRFALHYHKYHITYNSRSLPHKEAAILSGSLSEYASILIVWHLNPHFMQHLWCQTKRPCHTLSFCQALTENAHFVVVPMIRIFHSECSRHYWVIATPHASLLFFLFNAHTYTRMHQSAQHGTRWGSLKSQSHTCSPTHRVHTHIHLCSLSHWAWCPEVTLSWIDKVSQKRKSSLDRKCNMNN